MALLLAADDSAMCTAQDFIERLPLPAAAVANSIAFSTGGSAVDADGGLWSAQWDVGFDGPLIGMPRCSPLDKRPDQPFASRHMQSTRRILAIGGGGFLMEDAPSPIDRFIVALAGKPRPRVCYVGTPNGDMPEAIDKFYAAYPASVCEPSHLAFFRQPAAGSLPLAGYREHLLKQDVVFVAGGNTKSALGVWREWGLDRVFAEAHDAGLLLCGVSAGAMCWFEAGLTDSFWGAGHQPLRCLGLLPGACGVHYHAEPMRKEKLFAAVDSGALPAAIAIDDDAAVLYEDGVLSKVMAWRPGATAFAVSVQDGKVHERALVAEAIALDHHDPC